MCPDYSWAYFNLGSIFYEEGDVEKSKEYLQKTLELNPKDDNASIILSKIFAKEKDYETAINLLEDALENNPYNGEVYYTLAHLFKETGDIENYKQGLKEALNNHDTLKISIKQLQSELKSVE